jgi:hypothetical protein
MVMGRISKVRAWNYIALTLVAALFAGCATPAPTLEVEGNSGISFDGLFPIKNSAADQAWAVPSLDLTRYNKIMVQGVGIEYRPGGKSGRSSMTHSDGRPFEVTEEQKARFRQVVNETLLDELGKSKKFGVVNEPGPDVLLIRVALLDVVSYVPPESIGRSEIYLSEIGDVTLALELRDSISEAILARSIDRDTIGDDSTMRSSNRVVNQAVDRPLKRKCMSARRERLDSFSGLKNAG